MDYSFLLDTVRHISRHW